MANLGQDLSQNLGYNPFGNRRTTTAPAMQRMDGFSDDGLSYEVINDWGKLASQALAEYEAAIAHERQKNLSIDSRGIATSTPVAPEIQEAIYQEKFEPLRMLFGAGGGRIDETSPLRTYKTNNGEIVGINARDGSSKILFTPEPDPSKSFGPKQKSDLKMVESEILETRKLLAKAEKLDEQLALKNKLLSLERNRRKVFEGASGLPTMSGTTANVQLPLSNVPVSTVPAYTANWPQQGSFIGNPAFPNQFTNLSPLAPTVRTSRGNSFKISTR